MGEVVEIEQEEDKKTLLETISLYEAKLDEVQLQVDALEFGLGVLRKTVKEL